MATFNRLDYFKQKLEELNRQDQIWKEQQRDLERRVKEDFDRKIAKIEEDFAKAVENIELEYSVKKKALLNRHSGKNGHDKSVAASVPCNSKAQTRFVCIITSDSNSSGLKQHTATLQAKSIPWSLSASHNVKITSNSVNNQARDESVQKYKVQEEQRDDMDAGLLNTERLQNTFLLGCTVVLSFHEYVIRSNRSHSSYMNVNSATLCVFDPGGLHGGRMRSCLSISIVESEYELDCHFIRTCWNHHSAYTTQSNGRIYMQSMHSGPKLLFRESPVSLGGECCRELASV